MTLRFKAERKCDFLREHTYERTSPSHVTETTGLLGNTVTTKTNVVTTITDFYWELTLHYEISAFQGNKPEDRVSRTLSSSSQAQVVLVQRTGTSQSTTTKKETPYPAVSVFPNIDLNIGFLISNINERKKMKFAIKRDSPVRGLFFISTCLSLVTASSPFPHFYCLASLIR